ncbi:MAG: hypothetical protein QXF58_05920 [Desulfurococcaceae archaeon]
MSRSVISKIVLGVIEGVLYYIMFVVIIPKIVKTVIGTELAITTWITWSPYMFFLLGFFTALGIIASIVKEPLAPVFEALLTTTGLLIIVNILGTGVLEESVNIGGVTWRLRLDAGILVLCILGFSIIYSITASFNRVVKIEE